MLHFAINCMYLCIFYLRLMINYVNDPEEAEYTGYLYALLMFCAAALQSILVHQYFHRCFVVGMRARTALIAAVYQKVCTISINNLVPLFVTITMKSTHEDQERCLCCENAITV